MPTSRPLAEPRLEYPPELPVSARHDEIMAAIRDHQVVIIAGETGSGKTTQIPKMCLELGRGRPVQRGGKLRRRLIGHTQPRRIAAHTIAERLADETGTRMGETIGYQVRFTDRVGPETRVKVMTDGILLAELRHDPKLYAYDTIIIDEAHERSLNIDFLLGCLTRVLPQRPDLKLIITSATIDVERFSHHFGDAPIIEVSGRTYPVEVRYEDPVESGMSLLEGVGAAVDELMTEPSGDILVFFPTEADIRDAAKALSGRHRFTEVLPLFGRLSAAEQHRVFERSRTPGVRRRIVLATNVAETSLTVPGIRYVIDTGTARISRFTRGGVQRLPIEPISQASADQRAGRCGRVADGICIRLYSQDDYDRRPRFTDPEILRTNLASVVLQMAVMRLGEIEDFPFLQPPEHRQVAAGLDTLRELGAVEPGRGATRLTDVGREMADLPLDPRLARMLIEARARGCAADVEAIVAFLTVQDPRERPREAQEAADQAHARFRDKTSDFLTVLNLWDHVSEQREALSGSAFRRLCRREFLNYLRVREWFDLVAQLRRALHRPRHQAEPVPVPAAPRMRPPRRAASAGAGSRHDGDAVHLSLLAGLLSQLGLRDEQRHNYLGAHGAHFWVHPGSALFKKQPAGIMTAELVETSRMYARTSAAIPLEWAEPFAERCGLAKHQYAEPHWSRRRGAVVAAEKVTLYGLPIVSGRTALFAHVDAGLARELFIRGALVEGDWETRHAFFRDNQRTRAKVEELENRTRSRLAVDDEALFAFYDERIPAGIADQRGFDAWWKQKRREHPDLLTLDLDDVLEDDSPTDLREYPSTWSQGAIDLRLQYRFDPGADSDGVNADVPLAVLPQLTPAGFDWLVPGMREELVQALIRSLPKQWRRHAVPAADFARKVIAALPAAPDGRPFTAAVGQVLERLTAQRIPPEAWDADRLPSHLRMTFRVLDAQGRALAESTDLDALQRDFAEQAQASVERTHSPLEQSGLTAWTLPSLPAGETQRIAGSAVRVWPALVDEGDTAGVRVFADEDEAHRAHWRGLGRLVRCTTHPPVPFVLSHLTTAERLAVAAGPYRSPTALGEDAATALVDAQVAAADAWAVRDAEAFARLATATDATVGAGLAGVVQAAAAALTAAREANRAIAGIRSPRLLPVAADLRTQVDGLVFDGFVRAVGVRQLQELPRYLRAAARRAQRVVEQPGRDPLSQISRAQSLLAEAGAPERDITFAEAVADGRDRDWKARWMLEEFRVSVSAQELGTAEPVSLQRLGTLLRGR
jgi:ATP-dependent helicase HrpA